MLALENVLHDFKEYEQSHILNGSLVLAQGDRIVYSKCSGMADFEADTPCSLETQYNIASVSKQFTAVTLLRVLYDANPSLDVLKNSLQDPVSKYLPPEDFIWDNVMPEWANLVTIHQLLTHTCGIVNYTDLDEFWDTLYVSENPKMVDLIRIFKGQDLRFEPGKQYEYSNSAYVLLGQIIERLTKKTLSQYLKETFFIPLSMVNTGLPTEGTSLSIRKTEPFAHLSRGYIFDIKNPLGPYMEIKNYWPHSIDAGDGGLISTAPDLVKWNEALYKGRVLPQDVLALMLTPYEVIPGEPDTFYGYGIVIRKSLAGTIFIHGGSVPGYHTYPIYIPSLDVTVISVTNVTFDNSCIQDKRQAIKDELSDIEDPIERDKKYYEIFAKRHPEIEKIREQHALFKVKDIKVLESV